MAKFKGYLDNNATVPLLPEVGEVMANVYCQPMNPSSVHHFGREAASVIRKAREQVAGLVQCRPAEVTFTATGSESNALAIRGSGADYFLVSAIEHASVLRAVDGLPHQEIPVTEQGVVDLLMLNSLLLKAPANTLVAVMLANNETGVIQPVEEIARLVAHHGARLHVDAAQAVGKIPVNFTAMGADSMAFCGHKFGGPQGAAAFIARQQCTIVPQVKGGGQEQGKRGGTENVPAIAGFGKAAELADANRARIEALEPALRALESRINALSQDTRIIACGTSHRLPNTSCIATPGLSNETQLMALDLEGIAVSAGSACSAGRVEASHVLQAMGVEAAVADGAIRISTGWATDERDLERCYDVWEKLYGRHFSAASNVA